MADAEVTNVKIEGDLVIVTSQYKLSELHGERDFVNYQLQGEVREAVKKAIVEDILETHKKAIIDQILKDVNWPEIVRSEIARKVIAEAGREPRGY